MKRVVLTPELVVRSFRDASCLRILNAWRDGELTPVIDRDLALRYTKLLRSAGLGPRQLKRWLWWFTANDKSEYFPHIETDNSCASIHCEQLALGTKADGVVHSDAFDPPEGGHEASWISASRIFQ